MEVVSNSSPLISFAAIGDLEVLKKLFPEGLLIPGKVWEELMAGDPGREDIVRVERDGWLRVCRIGQSRLVEQLLAENLGAGEAEAIALARKKKALVLLDEHAARERAEILGLRKTGTVGCLLLAKQKGYILLIRPYLDRMRRVSFFRLSEVLYRQVIKAAGES